ncbi:MAG TPA: TetR family transcriptional regulator [Nocardioides sp.]|uniref:TetR family transcriptional regulator n=1 Tax=Nocardioides sp. TaxID=35761 RepID=UPI002E333366|nr:TetR family transcriptional regulator [Nocardioides sp.]HEX5090532.1 TetR family transcriptional regulator [Nocardioides sp.]
MPTGRAIDDARSLLFDAAERVLLRDGNAALTSRAITAEAGVAKGVLHRHFEDVDDFLAELVLDRIGAVRDTATALQERVGTGTVQDNVVGAIAELFESIASAVLELVTARDAVRARLRAAGSVGVPVLAEGTAMIAAYLEAEQDAGRVATEADADTLAATLVGAAHLLHAGRDTPAPDRAALERMVAAVLAGAVTG